MRVAPWNQCPLVEQKTIPDLQLASTSKNRFVCRCASFLCFSHEAAAARSSSSLEVGPAQNQEVLPTPVSVETNDQRNLAGQVDDYNRDGKILNSKSSLKKAADNSPAPVVTSPGDCTNSNEHGSLCEKDDEVACRMAKKVQWTDTTGGELFEVREFEMSDADDELYHGNGNTCSCKIM